MRDESRHGAGQQPRLRKSCPGDECAQSHRKDITVQLGKMDVDCLSRALAFLALNHGYLESGFSLKVL
jgi:hypothetical protein